MMENFHHRRADQWGRFLETQPPALAKVIISNFILYTKIGKNNAREMIT